MRIGRVFHHGAFEIHVHVIPLDGRHQEFAEKS